MGVIKLNIDELMKRIKNELEKRNGLDHLSQFIFGVFSPLLILGICMKNPVAIFAGLTGIGYGFYRILSSNIYLRKKENRNFLSWIAYVDFRIRLSKFNKEMKKDYKFYRCRKCKNRLRVPRGKGKIEITCPICGNKFIKRT